MIERFLNAETLDVRSRKTGESRAGKTPAKYAAVSVALQECLQSGGWTLHRMAVSRETMRELGSESNIVKRRDAVTALALGRVLFLDTSDGIKRAKFLDHYNKVTLEQADVKEWAR